MVDVSASTWNTTKATLNTLITDCNAVHVSSYTGTITPVGTTLKSPITTMTRTVVAGDDIKADDFSDADGIVTKYNALRDYDSCRKRTSDNVWHYGLTVSSDQLTGRRDSSFTVDDPAYITPPVAEVTEIYDDLLSIITAGCAVNRTTLLSVGVGSEYVVIDECHTNCHSSCHGSCNRGRR